MAAEHAFEDAWRRNNRYQLEPEAELVVDRDEEEDTLVDESDVRFDISGSRILVSRGPLRFLLGFICILSYVTFRITLVRLDTLMHDTRPKGIRTT